MQEYDLIIRNGMIYDGSGGAPYRGDVAINGDTIAALGDLGEARGKREVDVNGLAVAPGFINMLSWSVESLIQDGRSQSEIRQGVTLEVMGEGFSFGPLSDAMKAVGTRGILGNYDIEYDVEWTTLGEYLEYLEKRGVSPNIASFVGTSTLRIHVIGYDDRPATDEEQVKMNELVRQAMEEGAVGLSSALIYPPASYADVDELISLASIVSEYDGLYISHIRSEGSTFVDALEEFLETLDVANVRGEIYHLKAAGASNWDMMDEVIKIIEEERAVGRPITADMYTYPFSGTGLDACIPPWAHDGGWQALIQRLKDPQTRERLRGDMLTPSFDWENMYVENGPEKILLSGFRKEELKPLTGKTLAEVAAMRATSPEDTLMDLLIEDDSRIFTMYFCMSDDNLRKQMALPWVSFCSDAESQAAEGVFLKSNPHPRAYGSFARVLGKYVRDEKIIPLEEAVRRLTSFPAGNLKIEDRGLLKEGYYADVVVFDPEKVQDHATPQNPHQYATGMVHVFVNGAQVLQDGEHTGAKPGRVVRGPGWKQKPFTQLYPPALHPLLTLKKEYDGTYVEFNIGREWIPDLIRMATDNRLLLLEDARPQYNAPMHAWRILGQLRAEAAIEPLMKLFFLSNMQAVNDLPQIYAMIGMKAFPTLVQYMSDPNHLGISRVIAANCLREVATSALDAPPSALLIYEGLLIDQLKKYEQNDVFFNSIAVNHLQGMQSQAAVEVILDAYNAGAVSEELAGSAKEVMRAMGIRALDDKPDKEEDYWDGDDEDTVQERPALTSGLKSKMADKKKKAKRKLASKVKKLNRKKKR